MNNVLCFTALTDKKHGTVYPDATGALSAISLDGHQYFFVAYDYDTSSTSYTFAESISNVTYATIIDAFHGICTKLIRKDSSPGSILQANK